MSSPSISPEKQPVYIVVVFTLALLALVFTFYNNHQIEKVAAFNGLALMKNHKTMQDQVGNVSANFAALEARIAKLETQGTAAPVSEVQVN